MTIVPMRKAFYEEIRKKLAHCVQLGTTPYELNTRPRIPEARVTWNNSSNLSIPLNIYLAVISAR